jgi:hypothetical protein
VGHRQHSGGADHNTDLPLSQGPLMP